MVRAVVLYAIGRGFNPHQAYFYARMVELVDTRDLKSLGNYAVRVRFPLRAPHQFNTRIKQAKSSTVNWVFKAVINDIFKVSRSPPENEMGGFNTIELPASPVVKFVMVMFDP